MGWTQTREAPTQRADSAAVSGGSIENIDMTMPFIAPTPRRAVFVMSDELLRHGLIHVMSQGAGIVLVGDLDHGPALADRLRELRPHLLVVGPRPAPDCRRCWPAWTPPRACWPSSTVTTHANAPCR